SSATGTALERTPWHATQRASWEALRGRNTAVSEPGASTDYSFRILLGSTTGRIHMSPADPLGRTDKLDNAVLEALVTRLAARGKHPLFEGMLTEYLDLMRIDEARSVLDMGCGTGVASRTLLRRVAFTGRVTGIDLSPYLTQVAARLANEEGFGGRVTFRAGD